MDNSDQRNEPAGSEAPVAIVGGSEDAVIGKTLDGVVTSWNSGAERIFDYAASEMIGQSIFRLIPENMWAEEREIIAKVARGEWIEDYRAVRLTKGGRRIFVSLSVAPLRDGGGKVVGALKIARYLKARSEAEANALIANFDPELWANPDSRRLAAIVEGSDDAIYSQTLEGVVTSWNAAAERIFGYSAAEMIGEPIRRIYPAYLAEEEAQIVARLARGESVARYKTIRIGKDGRRISISLAVTPLRDAAGRIFGASKVARDLSARGRAEDALRAANEAARKARLRAEQAIRAEAEALAALSQQARISAIIDTAVDGIILMSARGEITRFNPACERIFGYSAAEAIGTDIKRLMPSPYRDEHDQYLENYKRTGHRKIIGIGREVMGRKKTGEVFPMDLSVGDFVIDGETYFVGILRDVSERKHAEALREGLIEQLTAANVERAHFARAASHDLREPLRMVTAYCARLAKGYADRLDDKGAEYLSLAVGAASRMSRVLDDLVDFDRLAEGARGDWFESAAAVAGALANLEERIRESGASVSVGALPRIWGNSTRFERLIQNLVGNALKYMAPGVTPRVGLRADRDGHFWRFAVADNGIGIEPRFHERIFEPFKRLHSRDRYDGTGLGLAICRKIVEGFGGSISVRSNPNEGSEFIFTVEAKHDGDGEG